METEVPYESLDEGIREAVRVLTTVRVLTNGGIETFESCQGGQGHAYAEPTIRFNGERSEGRGDLLELVVSDPGQIWFSGGQGVVLFPFELSRPCPLESFKNHYGSRFGAILSTISMIS